MLKHSVIGIALMGALVANSAPAAAGTSPQAPNIIQVAREAGTFTTLLRAIEAAGLVGTLSGQGHGSFTVFAPTDAAFQKLPAGTIEALLKDRAALRQILLYHVVSGTYRAADVVAVSTLPTLNGQNLAISTTGGAKVNDARIVTTDIAARNGVIHVLDTVLLPR